MAEGQADTRRRKLDLRTWSIRTKLLSLVLGLAFAVGAVSAVFSYVSSSLPVLTYEDTAAVSYTHLTLPTTGRV